MRLAKILIIRTDDRRQMKRTATRRRHLQMAAGIMLLVGAGAAFLGSGYFADPAADLAALATSETIPEGYVTLRFRGQLPASADLHDYKLEAGMEALVLGDYPRALETLEALYSEHPESAEASAYLGVARYLSGDDSAATKSLLVRGTEHHQPMIRRLSAWYLANSCLRSGDVESAVEILRTSDLIGTDTRYGRASEDLLNLISGANRE
jgi:hypothetical protein